MSVLVKILNNVVLPTPEKPIIPAFNSLLLSTEQNWEENQDKILSFESNIVSIDFSITMVLG